MLIQGHPQISYNHQILNQTTWLLEDVKHKNILINFCKDKDLTWKIIKGKKERNQNHLTSWD